MAKYQPYQMALGRQDEVRDILSRISQQGETSGARVGKIKDLKNELFNIQQDKYKKIEKSVKESERRARKGGGLRKLLKVAGMFMGPLGAGLTSGISGYMGAKRQKGALKHLAKALARHGEFSAGWRGKMGGLNWLSQPTKQFSENVMSGKRDVEKSASSIKPFQTGLTSGLTSALSAKVGGKEGIFGGGKLKDALAGIGEGGVKNLLSKQFLPGFTGQTQIGDSMNIVPQTMGQYLKANPENLKEFLSIMPQISGALQDNVFEIPDFNRQIYGR